MAKIKTCAKCGCDRKVLINKSTITQQTKATSTSYSYKCLCVPCFLTLLKLEDAAKFKNLPKYYLECCSQDEE